MKINLFLLIIFTSNWVFCQNNIIAHSNKRNVKFIVNNKIKNWSISPKTKPDVFKVYCYKKENKVSL